MRNRFFMVMGTTAVAVVLLCADEATHAAQAPAPKPATPAATRPAARPAAPAARAVSAQGATVQQVMKGILFPASNVIFYAQAEDPTKVPPAKDPSLSSDPLSSTYGGWEAVENASLALSESVRLLSVARACANGKPAPISSPTWQKGMSELRAAGQQAYAAAKAKDMDKILDASDAITTACSTCHEPFREKTPRCVG